MSAQILAVAHIKRVVFLGHLLEDGHFNIRVLQRRQAVGKGHAVRGGKSISQCRHNNSQITVGGEGNCLLGLSAHRSHFCPTRNGDRLGLRGGKTEGDIHHRRFGWLKVNTNEFHELDVILLRHPVQPVEKHVYHPGEKLNQCNSRVAEIVVRPFGTIERNLAPRLADNVLKFTVV